MRKRRRRIRDLLRHLIIKNALAVVKTTLLSMVILLSGSFFVLLLIGCSDIPYAGSMLTPDDLDKYIIQQDSTTLCLTNGFDERCVTLIHKGKDPAFPIIHIFPKKVIYVFYLEGIPVIRAERPIGNTGVEQNGGGKQPGTGGNNIGIRDSGNNAGNNGGNNDGDGGNNGDNTGGNNGGKGDRNNGGKDSGNNGGKDEENNGDNIGGNNGVNNDENGDGNDGNNGDNTGGNNGGNNGDTDIGNTGGNNGGKDSGDNGDRDVITGGNNGGNNGDTDVGNTGGNNGGKDSGNNGGKDEGNNGDNTGGNNIGIRDGGNNDGTDKGDNGGKDEGNNGGKDVGTGGNNNGEKGDGNNDGTDRSDNGGKDEGNNGATTESKDLGTGGNNDRKGDGNNGDRDGANGGNNGDNNGGITSHPSPENDPNPSGHNPPDNVLSHYVYNTNDDRGDGWIVWVYYPHNYVKDDNNDGVEDNPRNDIDHPNGCGFTLSISGGIRTNFVQASGSCIDNDNDNRDDWDDVPCSDSGSDYSAQFFVASTTSKITLTIGWTAGMYYGQTQIFNIMKEISMKDWDEVGYDPGHTNQDGW